MNAMNRRAFLGRTTALVAASIAPIPKAMAISDPEARQLFWYAVGDDEMSYDYLGETAEAALREYAICEGKTVGEECPECAEPGCYEHNDDLDAPFPWLEVHHKFGPEFTPSNRPKTVDWCKAGFRTICEGCEEMGVSFSWDECLDTYPFQGKALCDECLEIARGAALDSTIGNEMKPTGRETG